MNEPVYLLDVNVLVALLWPPHQFHAPASAWFKSLGEPSWATCPFTQAAFVRLLSNSSFASPTLTPLRASELLTANLKRAHHIFWPMDITFADAIDPFSASIVGHRQVTDAYLLGLAMTNNGKLATFDQGINALLPKQAAGAFIVEV